MFVKNLFRSFSVVAVVSALHLPTCCAEDMYGLLDPSGRVKLEPVYTYIGSPTKGTLVLARPGNQKSQVMSASGELTEQPTPVEPKVPKGSLLLQKHDRFTIFKSPDGGFGVINDQGEIVIQAEQGYVFSVGEDMFVRNVFKDLKMICVLMDSKGHQIAEFPQNALIPARKFSEGVILVGRDFSSLSYYDKSGKPIPSTGEKITEGGAFTEGLANVSIDDHGVRAGGFIDHSGKLVIGPFQKAITEPFSDKIGIVSFFTITPEGTWNFKKKAIDHQGKFLFSEGFDSLSRFSKNMFVASRSGVLRLVNTSDAEIAVFPESCGQIKATNSDDSNQLIPCGFVGKTIENRIIEKQPADLEWGYCDMHGKIVIKPQFRTAEPFVEGLAIVSTKSGDDKRYGLIDSKGAWATSTNYKSMDRLFDRNIVVAIDSPVTTVTSAEEHRPLSKREKFENLLREHNIIGMTLDQLNSYLGAPMPEERKEDELLPGKIKSTVLYNLSPEGPHCGLASLFTEFGFDETGRVYGWRQNGMQSHGYWYTDNVVYEKSEQGLNIPVPKP